jgi:hypothetical protein
MSEAAAPAAAPAAAAPAAAGAAAPAAATTPATPAAPATPPAVPAPAAPAATPPAPATAPGNEQDVSALPQWAQERLAAAERAQAQPPAPASVPAPVPAVPGEGDVTRLPRWAQQAVTDGQGAARQLAIQTAVISAAPAAGADVSRLLDSQAAMRALSAVDPNDAAAVQQAITNTLATHPHLAAATAPPAGAPRGGVEFTAPSGEVTPQQFAAMDYRQRAELYQSDPDTYRRLAG